MPDNNVNNDKHNINKIKLNKRNSHEKRHR